MVLCKYRTYISESVVRYERWHAKYTFLSGGNAGLARFPSFRSYVDRLVSVARKINFKDPDVTNYVRIAYVTAQIVILVLHYYVSYAVRFVTYSIILCYPCNPLQIRQKNDQTMLKYGKLRVVSSSDECTHPPAVEPVGAFVCHRLCHCTPDLILTSYPISVPLVHGTRKTRQNNRT
jgi:hypothetical protein